MADLSKMIDHCIWANGVWLDFTFSLQPPDEYLEVKMSHILLGEQIWFQRIHGERLDTQITTVKIYDELKEMTKVHRTFYNDLLQNERGRMVTYTRLSGAAYKSTVADILTHLFTHGAHHRGQMASHAVVSGFSYPDTDFLNYCMEKNL